MNKEQRMAADLIFGELWRIVESARVILEQMDVVTKDYQEDKPKSHLRRRLEEEKA